MDTQKALQTLLKIAQNQQKMIEEQQKQIAKLAQLTNQALPPQKIEPVKPELHPEQVVLNSLPHHVRDALRPVMPVVAHGTELKVFFQPGKASQVAVDQIVKSVQALVSQNKLPFAYTVKAV